ncbi:AT-hook motif nuclear-localized protein 10 [Vitis vinifera]|uniref:AT-hook motif nuclear-localized protein n=1 Tax=Vitis vinifera TaxID=29760 RepID=A0A438JZZ1_VITVI|nr:AT-hook motif nuclear-localized protein 10 [Vitis vinifera]
MVSGSCKDIASKIMAFSQQGPRTVCILSANGAICNVTLRQPAMSGGTISYEELLTYWSLEICHPKSSYINFVSLQGILCERCPEAPGAAAVQS